MTPLRILIADEQYVVRHGLKTLVESHPGWNICAEARTGREAVSAAEKLKPDIAILGLSMPELNGLEATKRIRKSSPNTEILILSTDHSEQLVREILGVGARGYILTSDWDRDLVSAVKTIANHESFLTPPALQVLPTRDVVALGATIAAANEREYGLECSEVEKGSEFCTKCGKQAGIGTRFCSYCGERVIPTASSRAASVDQADIHRMQYELAELFTLVEQPLQEQLDGIKEGKTGDPTARDYIMEELLAVAVRFYGFDTDMSERVAQVCWEIFTYLTPSKYDCLTPTTMAQLMATMAQELPQRYSGELESSSFLSLSLLSHSDQTFGTNYGQKFREGLCRFSHLISKTQGVLPGEESELPRMEELPKIKQAVIEDAVPRAKEESELHRTDEVRKIIQVVVEDAVRRAKEESELPRMEEVPKIKQALVEDPVRRAKEESGSPRMEEVPKIIQVVVGDAIRRAKEESELHRTDEAPKIIQAVMEDTVPRAREESELYRTDEAPKIKWAISAEQDVPQIIAIHDNQSTLRTVTLAIERVRAILRTILNEAIANFSGISALLQKLKHWLNAPMK
jgi:CheY-like chemotaxis protein